MALIPANNTPLKPDDDLAQAIDDYEKVLSAEERIQLHAQGPPDALAAFNFTTTIDRECNSRGRCCTSPRLITFLESVQHFTGVVDTFVSSHPEFAALHFPAGCLFLSIKNSVLLRDKSDNYVKKSKSKHPWHQSKLKSRKTSSKLESVRELENPEG
ncbi:MAG: hypothetical protein Q9200_006726 [Gallowayella weberi]